MLSVCFRMSLVLIRFTTIMLKIGRPIMDIVLYQYHKHKVDIIIEQKC